MRLPQVLILGLSLAGTWAIGARACPNAPAAAPTASAGPRSAAPASAPVLLAWKPRAWSPALATATGGLRVSIDPLDGVYGMPAADQVEPLVVVADDAPVSVVRRANCSGFAKLDERFAEFAVVTLGPDGKPRWTCVHGPSGAAKFMSAPDTPGTGVRWEDR